MPEKYHFVLREILSNLLVGAKAGVLLSEAGDA